MCRPEPPRNQLVFNEMVSTARLTQMGKDV